MTPRLLAGLTLVLATAANAQSPLDASYRGGAQYVTYTVGGGFGVTIAEMAIPAVVVVPFGSRFTIDLGTAFASSKVSYEDGQSESISGLTDTQIRGNLSLGEDWIVITAGVNLPTGQTTVKEDQFRAANYIGNELLAFPITSMGSGFGTTAGFALARPWGDWNIGFGASMRYSAEYEPYDITGVGTVRYQPGNEYRTRLGADHAFAGGRAAVGLTYSTFGNDEVGGGTVYGSGDRWVTQAGYSRTMRGIDWTFSAWDLFRGEGIRAGQRAPTENMISGSISAGFNSGGVRLEPSAEYRYQASEQQFVGSLFLFNLRSRFQVGPLAVLPAAGYAIGAMATVGEVENPRVTGWRGSLTVRYR